MLGTFTLQALSPSNCFFAESVLINELGIYELSHILLYMTNFPMEFGNSLNCFGNMEHRVITDSQKRFGINQIL